MGICVSKGISDLESKWNIFFGWADRALTRNLEFLRPILSIIKPIMINAEIKIKEPHHLYKYAEQVYKFTLDIKQLKSCSVTNPDFNLMYNAWHDLLKYKKQNPLKIINNGLENSECNFELSLALMNGENMELVAERVDCHKINNLNWLVKNISAIDRLAFGTSFAGLPLVEDKMFRSVLEHENTMCIVLRTQSDRVISYCWGVFLDDLKLKQTNGWPDLGTMFYICDFARRPDFYSINSFTKEIVSKLISVLLTEEAGINGRKVDLIGFQHKDNKFYRDIFAIPGNYKKDSKKVVSPVGLGAMVSTFINIRGSELEFPTRDIVEARLKDHFYATAPSVFSYAAASIAYFGNIKYNMLFNKIDKADIEEDFASHQRNSF